jgi:hypothetical protein
MYRDFGGLVFVLTGVILCCKKHVLQIKIKGPGFDNIFLKKRKPVRN